MSRWEVEDEDWDRVRDQLKDAIIEVARRRDLIAYSDLVRGVPEIDGAQSHALAAMLGEIGGQCRAEGLPLLSSLVVYKDKSGPGPGFYQAAEQLGLSTGSNAMAREEFWWRQVAKCHEYWAR
ncbi:hypothetical protein ABUW04_18020 [Streptacidiphilus sp. N1-10]|uniref:Uncharacterized protein n=1 Tax=Streptacidiphilus jeojiensis TaxID=3229225 RepID=A0ABV6XPG4_9ACTN